MELINSLSNNETITYITKINFDTINYDVNVMQRYYDINRFKFKKDQIRSVVGRILLKQALKMEFGIDFELVKFKYNKFGKPVIANYNVDFSISHSGSYVCCSICKDLVGVDLENINISDITICDVFFTEEEQYYVHHESQYRDKIRFASIWSSKEAYLKYLGVGLSKPLSSISIQLSNGIGIIKDENVIQDVILNYQFLYNSIVLSICHKKKNHRIINIDYNNLVI